MPWVLRGLRDGVVTTDYPRRPDPYADTFPAAVRPLVAGPSNGTPVDTLCPTGAIRSEGRCSGRHRLVHPVWTVRAGTTGPVRLGSRQPDRAGCIAKPWSSPQLPETDEAVERARRQLAARVRMFRRSVHIRHVDAGSDGARSGRSSPCSTPSTTCTGWGSSSPPAPGTPTCCWSPGPASPGWPNRCAAQWRPCPDPVVVIAAGTDAVSGGLVAPSYAVAGGIGELVDVDVWVPGSPPTPFSLLHALLLAVGRIPPEGR